MFVFPKALISAVVMVMILVFLAMAIDLVSGLWKATQRKELHTSEALKRSLTKFISYEGGLAIAAMVDLLINLAGFYSFLHLEFLINIPVVTILIGIFLLVVEFMSVREKADEKTKKQQKEALELVKQLGELVSRDKAILDQVKNLVRRDREELLEES